MNSVLCSCLISSFFFTVEASRSVKNSFEHIQTLRGSFYVARRSRFHVIFVLEWLVPLGNVKDWRCSPIGVEVLNFLELENAKYSAILFHSFANMSEMYDRYFYPCYSLLCDAYIDRENRLEQSCFKKKRVHFEDKFYFTFCLVICGGCRNICRQPEDREDLEERSVYKIGCEEKPLYKMAWKLKHGCETCKLPSV